MGEFINDRLELGYTKARRILLQEKEMPMILRSFMKYNPQDLQFLIAARKLEHLSRLPHGWLLR